MEGGVGLMALGIGLMALGIGLMALGIGLMALGIDGAIAGRPPRLTDPVLTGDSLRGHVDHRAEPFLGEGGQVPISAHPSLGETGGQSRADAGDLLHIVGRWLRRARLRIATLAHGVPPVSAVLLAIGWSLWPGGSGQAHRRRHGRMPCPWLRLPAVLPDERVRARLVDLQPAARPPEGASRRCRRLHELRCWLLLR